MNKKKRILITGGTGTFGKAFVKSSLKRKDIEKIFIYSRDEMKQWNMRSKYQKHKNLFFIIGDVKEKESLLNAFKNVEVFVPFGTKIDISLLHSIIVLGYIQGKLGILTLIVL